MMRVQRLDLISYGQLRDESLDFSSPDAGLTVVVGPNEAGKSTAMRALVSLLFGIERRTTDDHGYGREGLKVGANLQDDEGRTLEIVRQGLARLPLVDPDGSPVDEALLLAFLGGVGRNLYTTLFCVDHDELHENSEALLKVDGEIGQLVFGASLGATVLSRVLADLDGRADSLFRPQGKQQKLVRSLTRRRDLLRDAKACRVRSRDWEKAEGDRVRLERELERLRSRLTEVRSEHSRLGVVKAALPLVAQRAELLSGLAEAEGERPPRSTEWAEGVRTFLSELERVKERCDSDVAERNILNGAIAELDIPEDLLSVADDLDLLFERIERYRKDVADLPKLETRLEAGTRRETDLLWQSGLSPEIGRGVTEVQMAELERLARDHVGLTERLAAAERERDEAKNNVSELKEALALLPQAIDVQTLSRQLDLARPFVEQERRLPIAQAELDAKRGDARLTARKMGLERLSDEQLEALAAPGSDELDAFREARTTLEIELKGLNERRAELEQGQVDAESRRLQLTGDPSTPDPSEVLTSRSRRDEGWSLVRADWLEGGADQATVAKWTDGVDLAGAYAEAVRLSDVAADRRFEHAEQLTNLDAIEEAMQSSADQLGKVAEKRGQVEGRLADLDEQWGRFWRVLGIEVPAPRQTATWLEDLREAQRSLAECRAEAGSLDAEHQQVVEHVEALAGELRIHGQEANVTSLAELVEQAKALVNIAEERKTKREKAVHELATAQRALPRRQATLKGVEAALAEWRGVWKQALESMHLESHLGAEAALRVMALVRDARNERRSADELQERVSGLRQDIGDYRERVFGTLSQVHRLVPGVEPDAALMEVKPTLAAARRDANRRATLEGQLEPLDSRIREANVLVLAATRGLERLREEAALGPDADLAAEAARAVSVAEIREEVRSLEQLLVAQSDGRTLSEVLCSAEEYGFDGSRIDSERESLEEEAHSLEGLRDEESQQLADVRAHIRAMDATGQAAAYEQEAELELAQLADDVHQYARLALARELLRQVVAEYGRQHQGPLVERASDRFVRLTDGAFSGLVVDFAGDSQVLLAQRRNDELLRVTQLSEGTLDQLYLALRLAGIEHQLERCVQPLPVVLDDLLINFDDDRARAAIEVLAELGQRTQVLLFTHHEHVCDMACNVLHASCVSVTKLKARDHDSAPSRRSFEQALPTLSKSPRVAAARGHEQAVIEVLQATAASLGKTDILARASIPESAWQAVIRSLVDGGLVVQEGAKRGARYRLSS